METTGIGEALRKPQGSGQTGDLIVNHWLELQKS